MPTISKGLLQAYEMQDFAHLAAMALKESLTIDGKLKLGRGDAKAIADLMGAWRTAQERISFHRRVPSPGSLKPAEATKRRRGRGQGTIELVPAQPITLTDAQPLAGG